jgi:Rhomboid family
MLPLSDGLPARRFPVVNVVLIVANFAVWLFYELPGLNSAIYHASFYPCTLDGACHGPEPWAVSWITAMFLHGGWDHILGNMLFLAIFGKNVEDALGSLWYLLFYLAGGFVAMLTQTAMTLWFGTAADARVPTLGASGAIAAVLAPTSSCIRALGSARTSFPSSWSGSRPGSGSASGSCTSRSRRTSGCPTPRRTAAGWHSSPTSAGSPSARWPPGPSPERAGSLPRSWNVPQRSGAGHDSLRGSDKARSTRPEVPSELLPPGAG